MSHFASHRRSLMLTALALATAMALPQAGHASAFQLKENSAKGMGRAYAGSTTAGGDASVVVNNPAAMTLLDGTYFQADLSAINFSAKFHGSAQDALGRPIGGGHGGDAGTTVPVPAFFIATKIADRWHLGLGFSVPFGFKTDYDNDWVGRYNAIKSKFQSLDATLSASYDVTDAFTLGVSAIAQKTSAEHPSAVNFNPVARGLAQQGVQAGALPPAFLQQVGLLVPPGSDGFAKIKGDDWDYGWQVGAFWKISPQDRLALSYRSKIDHKLDGTGNFKVPTNVAVLLSSPLVAPLLAGAGGVPFTHSGGTAAFTTPAVAGLSYWHQDEKFGLGLDLSWTKWDVFKDLVVNYDNPAQPPSVEPLRWRNSWYGAIGGDYYLNEKVTLRGGVAVDTTPTHASTRDPRVPDSTRKLLAFGIGYQASQQFEINASYMHVFVNKAHTNSVSSTGDVLSGNFDDYGNVLALSAQYKF